MQALEITSLCLAALAIGHARCNAADQESIQVTVTGKLQTGIVAIGGETTGTTISAKGVTWELDFGHNKKLHAKTAQLGGKLVTVSGSLARRKGVEIKERWIVSVTSLKKAADKKSPIEAETKRDTSRIQILDEKETTIIDVTSKFGIDSATLTRQGARWPQDILVRLHLGGLESFKVEAGRIAVGWSVASTGDHRSSVALFKGGKESQIAKGSPYFTQAKTVGGDGKIPLEGGYFEVPLPAQLLEGNPQTITLRWIDFYR